MWSHDTLWRDHWICIYHANCYVSFSLQVYSYDSGVFQNSVRGARNYKWSADTLGILCCYAIPSGRHPGGSQRPPGRLQQHILAHARTVPSTGIAKGITTHPMGSHVNVWCSSPLSYTRLLDHTKSNYLWKLECKTGVGIYKILTCTWQCLTCIILFITSWSEQLIEFTCHPL